MTIREKIKNDLEAVNADILDKKKKLDSTASDLKKLLENDDDILLKIYDIENYSDLLKMHYNDLMILRRKKREYEDLLLLEVTKK